MVKVEVESLGVIEIDPQEYTGDMHEFLKKIFRKKMSKLTDEMYDKKVKGKFILRTKDGVQLSEGVQWKDQIVLSQQEKSNIIHDRHRLVLSSAPMANTPQDDEETIKLKNKITEMKDTMSKTGIDHSKGITKAEKELEDIYNSKASFVQNNVVYVPKKGGMKIHKKRSGKKRRTMAKKRSIRRRTKAKKRSIRRRRRIKKKVKRTKRSIRRRTKRK